MSVNVTITSDNITLVTVEPVSRVIISYGKELKIKKEFVDLNTTTVIITKNSLELESLLNTYFKIDIYNMEDQLTSVSSHKIEIINQLETKLYAADKLKQDLDTLNYYEGIIQSLDSKLAFLEANDMFLNYLNFLVNNFKAKSFLNYTGKNDINK